MITYKFKWRRRWFWRKKIVVGHRYDDAQNKMVLYLPDGSQRELKRWRDCEVFFGRDGIEAIKKNMEAKTGGSVPLNV